MFYFIEFFKAWRLAPWRGPLLVLAIALLPASIVFSGAIIGTVIPASPLVPVASSEATLSIIILDDVNDEAIVRQLKSLPGVDDVRPEDSAKLKEKVNALVSSLDVKLPDSVTPTFIHGYRLDLAPASAERSASLIKEYLDRMVAKDKVSLSTVKMPSMTSPVPIVPTVTSFSSTLTWVVWGLALAIWCAAVVMWGHAFRPRAYLIEQFQRRRFVSLKVIMAGHITIFMVVMPLLIWNSENDWNRLAVVIPAMLLLLPLFPTRWQWRS